MSKFKKLTPDELKKMTKGEREKYWQKCADHDNEKIKGVFKNLETPGGSLQFGYKWWPSDEYKFYDLVDGERYELPRGVVAHLSVRGCYFKRYKHVPGTDMIGAAHDGRLKTQNIQFASRVHRFSWQSLEFMDDYEDEFKPSGLLEPVETAV